MGRKVHPYGFRLGTSRTWNAKWYADKGYTALLKEDITIRQLVGKRLANASVSLVDIERGINHVTVTVTWLIPRSMSTRLTLALASRLPTSWRMVMSSFSSVLYALSAYHLAFHVREVPRRKPYG